MREEDLDDTSVASGTRGAESAREAGAEAGGDGVGVRLRRRLLGLVQLRRQPRLLETRPCSSVDDPARALACRRARALD